MKWKKRTKTYLLCDVRFVMLLVLGLCMLCPMSCRKKPVKAASQAHSEAIERRFPYPEVPQSLSSPEERRDYLLTHFWEGFDFADAALVADRECTEQGMVNFIALLQDAHTPDSVAELAVHRLAQQLKMHAQNREPLLTMMERYLNDASSPMRNDALFLMVGKQLESVLPTDDPLMERWRFSMKLARRNQPGSRAEDFAYTLSSGQRGRLSTTPVGSEGMLLLFFDPECENCHALMQQMAADGLLNKAITGAQLTVLAVSTVPGHLPAPGSLMPAPQGWIWASDDGNLDAQLLYDLRAIPTLYWLDPQKMVVLKDAPYEQVRRQLAH